ncbi:hypothetical protein [Bradyrhizobium tropiciagri]|uniref:hypothetical protein n=1 Tax=Bradyrhizobium tropiciagri TaxID=312253 RepID=UPI00138F9794|nr:hypothetical protein [Bradyrhizobium tropiciagri]
MKSYVDSIVAIAQGEIGGAAKRVEAGFQSMLTLAISFFAGFVGLGGIPSKVKEAVGKLREMVDHALDTAITWLITKAKALFASLFGGKDKDAKLDTLPFDATVAEPFSMGPEGHTIKADLHAGELKVTVASAEADLVSALKAAIAAESKDTGRQDSQRNKILIELNAALSRAQSIREDWIALEARDPANPNKKVTYERFMTGRVREIIGRLRELAKYNITDLQNIIAKPTKRYIPKGINIRPTVYDKATGGKWASESKTFRNKKKAELSQNVFAIASMRSVDFAKAQSEWNNLLATGRLDDQKVPTFASYNHAKDFPPLEYETDHRKSLGEFWNAGENDKDDATRSATALDQSNWQLLTARENAAKSGVGFNREVGPNFASAAADSPAGSSTINGQPYLDHEP